MLTHFDCSKVVILSCDASPYGLRVVLTHHFKDGSEHPVALALQSLTSAEKDLQLAKEECIRHEKVHN